MNVYIYNAIFGTDLSTNITKGKIQSFVTDFLSTNNLPVCPSRSLFAQLVSFTYIYGFMVRSHLRSI